MPSYEDQGTAYDPHAFGHERVGRAEAPALNLTLRAEQTPAMAALTEVAVRIAEAEGPERALEWAQKVVEADPDLFIRCVADRAPAFRLIEGGRPGAT